MYLQLQFPSMSHLRRAWRRKFQNLGIGEDQVDEDEVVYLDEQRMSFCQCLRGYIILTFYIEQEELISSLRVENETINYRYKVFLVFRI